MQPPLIGITAKREENKHTQIILNEYYTQSILSNGGLPVILPTGMPGNKAELAAIKLDGILISGGGDLEPATYHGSPHAKISGLDPARDELELSLVHACLKHRIPLFGICRGLQVINVAMGGSLYADITDQYSRQIDHSTKQFDLYAHTVDLLPDTHLAEITNARELRVNSLHHQAIRELAPGLKAVAHAPDGLMEAVEGTGGNYLLAVQWHPEALAADPAAQAIFSDFVHAAAKYAADHR